MAFQMNETWENRRFIDPFLDNVKISSNAAEKAVKSGEFSEWYSNALFVESGPMQISGERNGWASSRLDHSKFYKTLVH